MERSDTAGNIARLWLEWLAETPRHILTGAMMADAGDECMILTRFCYTERMDPAELARHVAAFLSRVTSLFGQQAQCLTLTGYTKFLIETLCEPLVWVVRGKSFSLLAPSDTDVAFALDHMRPWVKTGHCGAARRVPGLRGGAGVPDLRLGP